MAIDDRLRLRIHRRLEELMGSEEADALVEAMLPVPWREVATKDDIRVLDANLRGELHRSLAAQTRWFVGFNIALAAVVITVVQLLG